MNFKLTKGKVIGSIIVPVIIWVLVFTLRFENPPSIIRRFLEIHNISNIFSFGNISLFIIEIVIVYSILSLIQKKKIIQNTPLTSPQ
jgi:hypothetical protein